jgi:predicted Zn finger-like uncharacterized protein
MIIECPNCHKQYNINAASIKRESAKFRCQACDQIVLVRFQDASAAPTITPKDAPVTTPPPSDESSATAPGLSDTAGTGVENRHPASADKPSWSKPSITMPGKPPVSRKRLGVGGKMLLLFFLIPVVLMVTAGVIYLWEFKSLTDNITNDSYQIVERLAHDLVNDTAQMVSEQCRLYLQNHSDLLQSDFNKDAEFRQLAMQPVGKTGYTCIYAVPDSLGKSALLVHPNDKIIGIDLPSAMQKALGNNFSAWFDIYKGAFSGQGTRGYYNWKEKDGSMRKKYMTCVPVRGTPYIVAATTYVDEINHDVDTLMVKASQMTRKTAMIILGVFLGTLAMIGTSVLLYGRRLKGNLTRLTNAAERISVGELNTEIKIQSNDEISDLADTIIRMQESIRLSIERLRRRR